MSKFKYRPLFRFSITERMFGDRMMKKKDYYAITHYLRHCAWLIHKHLLSIK